MGKEKMFPDNDRTKQLEEAIAELQEREKQRDPSFKPKRDLTEVLRKRAQ